MLFQPVGHLNRIYFERGVWQRQISIRGEDALYCISCYILKVSITLKVVCVFLE